MSMEDLARRCGEALEAHQDVEWRAFPGGVRAADFDLG
jgi:hypothetical protein